MLILLHFLSPHVAFALRWWRRWRRSFVSMHPDFCDSLIIFIPRDFFLPCPCRKSREILPVPIYIGDSRCSVVFNAGDWTLGHSKATIKIGQKNAIIEHHRRNDNTKWILRWYIGNWCWYWYGYIDAGAECVTKRGEFLCILFVWYVQNCGRAATCQAFHTVRMFFFFLLIIVHVHLIRMPYDMCVEWQSVSFLIWHIQSLSGNNIENINNNISNLRLILCKSLFTFANSSGVTWIYK